MATVTTQHEQLEKPELDERSYRVFTLQNELEVLAIHDPDTDKASASVNVNVGSFSDAEEMPGIAHAVEHVLFMGTEKYPIENEYSQYLTAHSGYSNAYTASTETNYYFEVAAGSEADGQANGTAEPPLKGALDRFAQFFVQPLFLAQTLDRELRAVDSENKKNLQSDNWRLSQLDKSLSNPKHPYHHFSTGNLETLRDGPRQRGIEVRQVFIDFYHKHYSANRMKLVVLGKEPLDELQAWAVEFFSAVTNKNLPRLTWPDAQPYADADVLKQVVARPVMDSRSLDITFRYQNEELLYETHPGRYLSHLIGHEGPGSVLAYIKAKGWANKLNAGEGNVCPDSGLFHIHISLTLLGLKEYKQVVETVFFYIGLIKESEPLEWIVDELKIMAEVDFRFKEKAPASDTTSRLSSVMQKRLPRKWLLSGERLIRRFDAGEIRKAMSWLTVDNYRISITSKDFPADCDQRERWYGTEYRIDAVPADLQETLRRAIEAKPADRPKELHLPARNEFIPTRLTVERKEVDEPAKAPKLIRRETGLRTWWKKDDKFWVPRASLLVGLRNPLVSITAANCVKTKIFCNLVKDALTEYSYDAEIAGLEYSLEFNQLGLLVEVSGYNDKMSVLLDKVITSMRDLNVKEDRFDIIKEQVQRGYRNTHFDPPYYQVMDRMRWLTQPIVFVADQYLTELEHINSNDIRNFIPQLLSQMHIEILAHGNLYKGDALRMSKEVQTLLNPRPLPTAPFEILRNLVLPENSNYVYRSTLKDPANVNNCIEYLLYVGTLKDRALRAKVLLMAQLGDERGFDQLRTKEQLGYIVFTGAHIASSSVGYRVIIQSERTPEYLEERIDAFLAGLGRMIEGLSQQEFEDHKRSLINKRLEKLKNLDQETTRFWNHISSDYFTFTQHEVDAANIRALSKQDMVGFFKTHIDPLSPTRAKLSVQLAAQTNPSEIAKSMTAEEKRAAAVDVCAKWLTSLGIGTDAEQLAKRLQDLQLDANAVKQDDVVAKVKEYAVADAGASEDQAKQIEANGGPLLATAFPALGIKLVAGEAGAEEKLEPPPEGIKAPTVIEDVALFKAGLQLSEAPRPAVDLSEFEELEPKL